jgi:hypothetical protein
MLVPLKSTVAQKRRTAGRVRSWKKASGERFSVSFVVVVVTSAVLPASLSVSCPFPSDLENTIQFVMKPERKWRDPIAMNGSVKLLTGESGPPNWDIYKKLEFKKYNS